MDRDSEFFRDKVADSTNPAIIWWTDLEYLQPLIVKEVGQVNDHLQHIKLENTEYAVSNKWLKVAEKE